MATAQLCCPKQSLARSGCIPPQMKKLLREFGIENVILARSKRLKFYAAYFGPSNYRYALAKAHQSETGARYLLRLAIASAWKLSDRETSGITHGIVGRSRSYILIDPWLCHTDCVSPDETLFHELSHHLISMIHPCGFLDGRVPRAILRDARKSLGEKQDVSNLAEVFAEAVSRYMLGMKLTKSFRELAQGILARAPHAAVRHLVTRKLVTRKVVCEPRTRLSTKMAMRSKLPRTGKRV